MLNSKSSKRFFQIVSLAIVLGISSLTYTALARQEPVKPDGDRFDQMIKSLTDGADDDLRISYHAQTGYMRFIGTSPENAFHQYATYDQNISSEQAARNFLDIYGPIFGIENQSQELELMTDRTLEDGRSFIRFQQIFQEVPVLAGELIVQLSPEKEIISVNGETVPYPTLDINPIITADSATQIALKAISQVYELDIDMLINSDPALRIYNPGLISGPGSLQNYLVWQIEVSDRDSSIVSELVLIDAKTGMLRLQLEQIHSALNRRIFDNNNNPDLGLPGNGPVRTEGGAATGINDVDLAYDFAGDSYNFYLSNHNRDSIDNNGMVLISTVRYCSSSCPYSNARWNGQQMIYGDGWVFDDIVAHELTHGVTEFTSGLIYEAQSGAINESFSDVWGEFVDLNNGAGMDTANVRWLVGEDLGGTGIGIRDMADPPAMGDPDSMSSSLYKCVKNTDDYGGVHSNSGINNKAVSLLTDGGSFNGFNITNMGIPLVADLYYEAQTNLLTSGSDYADLYDALIQACANLALGNSTCQNVRNALNAVEMYRTVTYVDLNAPSGGNSSCAEGVRTVQAGINATTNNGIIWIAPGIYSEQITINKPLVIKPTEDTVTIGQ